MKKFLLYSVIFFFCSCSKTVEEQIAIIWTDKTEVASYCELFNASQKDYKIIAEYKASPAKEILKDNSRADLVISSSLKGKETRNKFCTLDHLLKDKIDESLFYESLLSLGNIEGKQYLLPVSFNLPTLIFSISNKHAIENLSTISFEEVKNISHSFNTKKGEAYTKMCFSPRWEKDVLYIATQGMGASFEEKDDDDGIPFMWDEEALKKSILYLKEWSREVNENSFFEDEFKFKYLYDLPYILISNGFCTFYYMPTDALFSIPKEKMENIDFRYLTFGQNVPCKDNILYMGIISESKNKKTSEAFLNWFYSPQVQESLLNRKTKISLALQEFGIAGGFSALKPITEKIFPKYYPLLLSHLPPTQNITPPKILPTNWKNIKEELIFPYLLEATFSASGKDNASIPDLKEKCEEWKAKH